MDINKYFIYYKKPAQYLYWGDDYMDFYGIPGTEKKFKKVKTFNDIALSDISDSDFLAVVRQLPALDTGVILNSSDFIFNIFEFEKIPYKEDLKKDLVEWRLKKVFPESIEDYNHQYYSISSTRILSVLFKKSLKERIETLFHDNDIPLIHIGNSTVELLNHISGLKKSAADFFIESDKSLNLIVFQEQGVPYYIRKFRSMQDEDLIAEVVRTINYVKSSLSRTPRSYSLMVDRTHSALDLGVIREQLADEKITERQDKEREKLFFPEK